MTCVSKEYEIKTKMVQKQSLQIKMMFLLGYNLKIVIQYIFLIYIFIKDRVFPPSRENPILYENLYSLCGYYCYCYYYNGWKESEILVHNFFEHIVETFNAGMHHEKACISSAFIQKLVHQIIYLKSAFAMYKTYQLIVAQGNMI